MPYHRDHDPQQLYLLLFILDTTGFIGRVPDIIYLGAPVAILQQAAMFHRCIKSINREKCEGFSMVINENQKDYLRNKAYIKQIGGLFQK